MSLIRYNIKYFLNTISPKGRIAWEYNPLHNLRRTKKTVNGLHEDLVKLYGQLFTLINNTDPVTKTWEKNEVPMGSYEEISYYYKDINNNILLIKELTYHDTNNTEVDLKKEVYLNGKEVDASNLIEYNKDSTNIIQAGSIVDMDTELLNFSLNNPVDIDVLPSYDGSVNLILNDQRNPPRLINSRFSTRQLDTYEIVDRIGDNDTNIYDDDVNQFDIDTSLYKKYSQIPRIKFNKVIIGGNLKVGNYVLYFKYCDADDNETDFVAESGIISIFKGNDKDPLSIDGGFVDMNAHKTIDVTLSNIDDAYDYIKVYYTRTSSDFDLNRLIQAFKLLQKFVVTKNSCNIIITGDEQKDIIPIEELNYEYFIAESVKTQALCLNRLFLGNISRPDPLHLDLTDMSIRILPFCGKEYASSKIGYVDPSTYMDVTLATNNYEYYNTKNIYYNLGYWNEEIYRLGVVYIMYDNTLSKVYNIRGCESLPDLDDDLNDNYYKECEIFDDLGNRKYIEISEEDKCIIGGRYLENSRGVVRFNLDYPNGEISTKYTDLLYHIVIKIPKDVLSYLKNYCGIKGLFFVRQKRIPTIMAQGLVIPIDPEARVPLIYHNAKKENGDDKEEVFAEESFISLETIKVRHRTLFRHSKYIEKELTHDYDKRLIYCDNNSKIVNSRCAAILCPDFEVRQQYFNQFFTGTEFPIKYILKQSEVVRSDSRDRFYYTNENYSKCEEILTSGKLCSVTEEVPTIAIGNNIFRSVCGIAQEGFRFKYAFKEGDKTKSDVNLLRGIWHPYVAAVFKDKASYGKIVNIYIPGYNISEMANYYKVRYEDNSSYYPITDRMGIDDIKSSPYYNGLYYIDAYRGDCYDCTFTHRLNRNFQDPTAPANDEIVDKDSWKGFDPEDETTFDKINLGDINAIKMGSWYSFKVKSSTNLSIRSLDESHLEEKGLFGLPRGFYPLQLELESGNNKIPDSYNVNDGFRSLFGEKLYRRYPDVPYIKNNYENRILYSDIAVNDAYRNGYRVFKSTNFNDYTKEYGSIVKLVTMSSQGLLNGLLCVFEHGIGYVPVNERTLAAEGAGGFVYTNTLNILPDNIRVLSDKIGSQWEESIIQTPYGVYGVDTVAKKIWKTSGLQIEIISDAKVNKFLIDNISLTEREKTPVIGIRNVKTHYNANKCDVMFTFYDNLYGLEEKAWNLCWNELSLSFITFYSWIPSYSENIDNIYFSFDRETSKAIAKLGTSLVGSTNADGIVLDNIILKENTSTLSNNCVSLILALWNKVKDCSHSEYESLPNGYKVYIANIVGLANRILPDSNNKNITYTYEIEKDPYGNWKNFITFGETLIFCPIDSQISKDVWYVYLKCIIKVGSAGTKTEIEDFKYSYGYYNSVIAVTRDISNLTTDFWKHGLAGIIDIKDEIKPCFWYGKQHPFEFEFVVRETPNMHKVFDNLEIISNKAEPESFHFEVVGETYEFHPDKKNMYIRQELTKKLWQELGVNMTYDHNVNKLEASKNIKSTIFPLYYNRIDEYDRLYDLYTQMNGDNRDYRNLSGSEIVWDKQLNEFRILTHIKNTPVTKAWNEVSYNEWLRSRYSEDYKAFKIDGELIRFSNWLNEEITLSVQVSGSGDENNGITLDDPLDVTYTRRKWLDLGKIEFPPDNITNYYVWKDTGRIRGNSHYKEDRWKIQIPSITFMLKNEVWAGNEGNPPIVINYIPEEYPCTFINNDYLPNIYNMGLTKALISRGALDDNGHETIPYELKDVWPDEYNHKDDINERREKWRIDGREIKNNNLKTLYWIDVRPWTYRKEAKIRDKYMKVRIRYEGSELAVIQAVLTIYTESYG